MDIRPRGSSKYESQKSREALWQRVVEKRPAPPAPFQVALFQKVLDEMNKSP